MIQLSEITKVYRTRAGRHSVLDGVNLTVHAGEKIGILGRNGAGKSTLIRILSGAELPTSGNVVRGMSISWPLAFTGGFQGSLTGLDNLKFICRVYGADYRDKVDYVEDFSELGTFMREPVKTYSAGMRARLAFAISMAVDFSCFLIDEVVAVGDRRFQQKCDVELFKKRNDRAMIIVSHQHEQIVAHCDKGAVLNSGKLHVFDDVAHAYQYYRAIS